LNIWVSWEFVRNVYAMININACRQEQGDKSLVVVVDKPRRIYFSLLQMICFFGNTAEGFWQPRSKEKITATPISRGCRKL